MAELPLPALIRPLPRIAMDVGYARDLPKLPTEVVAGTMTTSAIVLYVLSIIGLVLFIVVLIFAMITWIADKKLASQKKSTDDKSQHGGTKR